MRVTTRGKQGSQKTRLGVAVATAMAVALSLSGFALANELPQPGTPRSVAIPGVRMTPRPGRVPPTTDLKMALHPATQRPSPKNPSKLLHRPYTLPVARRLISRAQLDRPHHDYPAWDLAVPVGTRVVAVRAGVVDEVTHSGNCGNGVVLVGTDNFTYTYCHGSRVKVRAGDRIATGELIMLSGSSGHSTGPHVHLQIQSPQGDLLCPQSLVTSWFNGGHATPESATSDGCFYITKKHHRKHRHHHADRADGSKHSGTGAGDGQSGVANPSGGGSGTTSSPTPAPSPSPSATRTPRPQPTASPSPTPLVLPSPTLT